MLSVCGVGDRKSLQYGTFYQNNRMKNSCNSSFMGNYVNYCSKILKLQRDISKMGVKADLFVDGNERNFKLAECIKNTLKKIFDLKIKIPKFKISLNNWEDMSKNTAAETETELLGKKNDITVNFNTPLYKNTDKDGNWYRTKKYPDSTTICADFLHEFAHAYQSYFNPKAYDRLLTQGFGHDEKVIPEISKNIGNYATFSKAEFVAEYFRVKMSGKNFKSEVLDKIYKDCEGPEIPSQS